MLGLVSWESDLRIYGAQRLPGCVGMQRDSLIYRVKGRLSGDVGVQEDSLTYRVRGRASSCYSLVTTHPDSSL